MKGVLLLALAGAAAAAGNDAARTVRIEDAGFRIVAPNAKLAAELRDSNRFKWEKPGAPNVTEEDVPWANFVLYTYDREPRDTFDAIVDRVLEAEDCERHGDPTGQARFGFQLRFFSYRCLRWGAVRQLTDDITVLRTHRHWIVLHYFYPRAAFRKIFFWDFRAMQASLQPVSATSVPGPLKKGEKPSKKKEKSPKIDLLPLPPTDD